MSSSPFAVAEHLIDASYIREYPHATTTQEAPLKLAVKKYTPVDNPNPQPGDITLVAVPGNGLPKELLEPLWAEIMSRARQDGFRIRAIWCTESVHQGYSGVANESYLGNDPSWFDMSRDTLHMINHFRDDMPRPIMGVGHSLGGVQQILLSLIHPRVFTSMILIDPFIHNMPDGGGPAWIGAFAKRPDVYPSREFATKVSAKLMKTWDPRVLELWSKHGFRDLPTAIHPETDSSDDSRPVTLTSNKHQETFSYIRPNFNRHKELGLPDDQDVLGDEGPPAPHDALTVPDMRGALYANQRFYRPEPLFAWDALPSVRPSVLYVNGAKSGLWLSGHLAEAAERTGTGAGGSGGKAYGRVKEVIIPKSGHHVHLEKVAETAGAIGPWLASEGQKWAEDEKRLAENWASRSVKSRSTLDKDWWKNLDFAVQEFKKTRKDSLNSKL
ncbi:hypothetical protein N7456_009233 [Penicillium angulare]|uniref:AB hydrolase-1 domain-containing protein n=1 Tax=Penicillium angulare TaxID=116970 RepID=A0A9W9F4H3_9EURO|nr:hypothetical protein N7456_009233 [Penicillium angulare]